MTWIRLYQEVLLEKVIAPASRCAELGLFGALAVAILPFVSEVLQLLPWQSAGAATQRHDQSTGEEITKR